MPSKKKQLIILGMHRSGTSLTSNIISSIGYDLGETLLGMDVSNVDGHFEDEALVNLNDSVLSALGCDWKSPPSYEIVNSVREEFVAQYADYVGQRNASNESWAVKDPRLSLTIQLMLPYLDSPRFIVCYRSVEAVAKSLNKRDGLSLDDATALYRMYNQHIERFFLENPNLDKLVIQYEDLVGQPDFSVKKILAFLGVGESKKLIAVLRSKIRGKKDLTEEKFRLIGEPRKQHLRKLLRNPLRVLTIPYWRKLIRLQKQYDDQRKNI